MTGNIGLVSVVNGKHEILKAIFAEAKSQGIPQETVREDIAPGVIGKRLSQARPQEAARVLEHIRGLNPNGPPLTPQEGKLRQYPSSRDGLMAEVRDLAIARFGQDYIVPFNNLCARFGESDGYRKLRVSTLKKIKQRLKELNRDDPWQK